MPRSLACAAARIFEYIPPRPISEVPDFFASVEPLAAKVPEITIGFWVLKLLTTAIGEAASDYLLSTMSFVGFGIGVAGFVSTLWIQFRTRRYNAFAYSAAVMMVAVFGTMAADVIHHQLGVSFTMSTLFCALGVAATFWAWHRIENTLSVHSIATRRREVFYWLAGVVHIRPRDRRRRPDSTSDTSRDRSCCSQLSWPCRPSGCWRFRLNGVVAFWWAYSSQPDRPALPSRTG